MSENRVNDFVLKIGTVSASSTASMPMTTATGAMSGAMRFERHMSRSGGCRTTTGVNSLCFCEEAL